MSERVAPTGSREVFSISFKEMGAGLSPYPFALAYPQDDHERFLIKKLKDASCEVEWGARLTGFSEVEDGVVARFRANVGPKPVTRVLRDCHHRRLRSSLKKIELFRRAAHGAEARNVASHLGLLLQMLQCLLQNARGRMVLGYHKPVMHPLAFAPRCHDSGSTKISKVPRDLWLASSQNLYEVADANLAVGDQVQQAKARRISQRTEEKTERWIIFCLAHQASITHLP
jgi:hypothetical protein